MFSLVSAVAVHSKGNMILFPWGYAADPPPHPNAEEMVRLLALSHLRHYAKQVLKPSWETDDKVIRAPVGTFSVIVKSSRTPV